MNPRTNNILMLNCFGLHHNNGELIHFSSLANQFFKKQKGNVSILHISAHKRPANKLLFNEQIPNNEVFIHGRSYLLLLNYFLHLPRIIRQINNDSPHTIYTRLNTFSAILIIALKLAHKDRYTIIAEHNGWMKQESQINELGPIWVTLNSWAQRNGASYADLNRAVSTGIKDYLVSMGIPSSKIFVIGNGTDTEHFRPMNVKPIYDIGFVGNLAKWQGLDWLIESFKIVTQSFPNAKLGIAGSGPEENHLQEIIDNRNLNNNIHLLGNIPYLDIPMTINSFGICIAPKLDFKSNTVNASYSYSPLKIRDYAACGKPIISSRIAGLEEIETGKFGLLVTPHDVEALAKAIIILFTSPELTSSMSTSARAYAVDNFSWDRITNLILHKISSL